jgi:hypothetical protein
MRVALRVIHPCHERQKNKVHVMLPTSVENNLQRLTPFSPQIITFLHTE